MSTKPIRVAVTGAAGQIGYSLLFRIASGEMLGKTQPVILQMLEIPDEKAQKALKGVMMELDDCAFPLLAGMVAASDPMVAFKDAEIALLVGARPRGPGMERKDLLEENGKIFAPQGKALAAVASRKVKVLVVGNPANTNCLIAMKNAPSLKPAQFTAMMRLDHNRAVGQIAQKIGRPLASIRKVTVWATIRRPSIRISSRRRPGARRSGRRSTTRTGWKRNSYRPYRSAAPRSSRRAGFPPRRARRTPPSTTFATGCAAPAPATGSAWGSLRTGVTAFRKASSTAIRSPAKAASTRSSRGSR